MPSLSGGVSEIRKALASRTGRNTQTALIGQVVTAGIGYLINVMLIRRLSVDDYGTFSLFSSVMMLLSGLLQLGWIDCFVRFGAEYANTSTFAAIERYFFKRLAWSVAVLGTLALAVSALVAERVYHRAGFTAYYALGVLGAIALCFFNHVIAALRARQEIGATVRLQNISSGVRFAIIGVILFISSRGLDIAVSAYLIAPLAGIAVGTLALRGTLSQDGTLDDDLVNRIRSYHSWLLVSMITTHLIGNIDAHFLAHYHDNKSVAAFGAAARLTLPLSFIVTAISTAVLPRLSASRTEAQRDNDVSLYLSKLKLFFVPALVVIALAVWLAPPVLIRLAGEPYQDIAQLLRLQLITISVVLFANPVGLVLYVWGRTKGFAVLNAAQLLVVLVLNYLWIPSYGAMGAVAATLTVNLIGLVYIYSAVGTRLLKRRVA